MMHDTVLVLADIYPKMSELRQSTFQEWESLESVEFLNRTIQNLGFNSYICQTPKELSDFLQDSSIYNQERRPILFNLVEGFTSRNREALIPSIAEFYGCPCTGGDSYSQILTLDKDLCKQIARSVGIPTAPSLLVDSMSAIPENLNGQWFIKPNAEGSSLGIGDHSLWNADPKDFPTFLFDTSPELLIERYLPGDEYSVGVLTGKNGAYKTTAVAKIECDGIYGEEVKSKDSMNEKVLFPPENQISQEIVNFSIQLSEKIQFHGYGRFDWKLDSDGKPNFLEANLTPGLSPYYSIFPICYQKSMGSYSEMIFEILDLAIASFGAKRFDYGKYKSNWLGGKALWN